MEPEEMVEETAESVGADVVLAFMEDGAVPVDLQARAVYFGIDVDALCETAPSLYRIVEEAYREATED